MHAAMVSYADDIDGLIFIKDHRDANAIAATAKEAGFSISTDDLTKAQSELSEEELEGVAGGVCLVCWKTWLVPKWAEG